MRFVQSLRNSSTGLRGGDLRLVKFIQKAVGYSLTGITTEQVLFFVYGRSGNNGKSTLVNLIREMLGDYGCTRRPKRCSSNR